MAKQVKNRKSSLHLGWRGPVVFLLTSLGILTLLVFSVAHWTERQILTTDNWVKLVAPLPKNDQVASALSSYAVNQLFSSADVEQKISQVLPEKASFLAPELTSQLKARVTNVTKRVIQSDRFQNIWVSANRAAHQRLIARARGDVPAPRTSKISFNLDLSSLRTNLRSRLGITSTPLFSSGSNSSSDVDIKTKFKTTTKKLSTYVKAVDFLDDVMLPMSLAFLLGALVVTFRKRRLLLTISASIVIVCLLQLIGVKALRPEVLNHVQDSAFRPAVGVIYDNLLGSFEKTATSGVIVGAIIFTLAYFLRSKFLRVNKHIAHNLDAVAASKFWLKLIELKAKLRQYLLQVIAAVVVITLLIMAFFLHLDWQGIIRSSLIMIIIIELVCLIAGLGKVKLDKK